jgi:hypothetical protein
VFCCWASWEVWAAPNAVVREETMALMFNPEPMPVDVMSALPLGVLLVALPLDGMTELIGSLTLAHWVAQFIGHGRQTLSKPRTNLGGQ